jgi:TPR repeat protein
MITNRSDCQVKSESLVREIEGECNLPLQKRSSSANIEIDLTAAAKLFRIAAEQNHPTAMSDYEICFKNGSAGKTFFTKRADVGNDVTQNNSGRMCEKGEGGTKYLIETDN